MQLIRKEDMQEFVAFTQNVSDKEFNPALRMVQDNDLSGFISQECVDAILALDRESATDQAKELYSFWYNYVRPYVVLCVHSQFIVTHGLNYASQGFVKFSDGANTSAPIEASERGQLGKNANHYKAGYLNKMVRRFSDVNQTFDEVTYSLENQGMTDRKPAPAISGLGKVNIYKRVQRL